MIDFNYVPETMEWCEQHYVPPIKKYIECEHFGNSDGMCGGCHWCMEMTPYQWHMCVDESWAKSLMGELSKGEFPNMESAAEFIEEYKQHQHIRNMIRGQANG